MELEVLLSTMNQRNFSLIKQANIQSDTIIINQSNKLDYEEKKYDDFKVKMYTDQNRGIGISRNKAIVHSRADICLIADDDIVYKNNYKEIILDTFEKNTQADIIIFDIDIIDSTKYIRKSNKNEKINKFNFMKHGGPKIAFRREMILKENIFFSLLFGGGAKYGSGEDSLFLKNALDKGLNIISVDKNIGKIYNDDSTWFNGFNSEYLYDRGALFKALFPKIWLLISLQFAIRHHNLFDKKNIVDVIKDLLQGAVNF